MLACPGGPGRDSRALPPTPPQAPATEPASASASSASSASSARRSASRMARRPEVLCGAAAVLLGCACLVALKVTYSRAKDVTMPAKLPVNFFSLKSPVHDFFLGQLDCAENVRQDSEIALFFFYAPWCGQSVAVREEIEKVASRLADQVLFVAINCWWNHGKCRKQKHFFYFPVIYLYHMSFGPIEYKGPMHAVYIEKFVRRVMSPLLYISSRSKLQRFLSHYEPGVLGYFEFNASPQPPGYLTFFTSALHSLNKDYLGTIHFGVITDQRIAKEMSLNSSGSIFLHRHVNTSLFYPQEATNCTAESVWKWALENCEMFLRWLRPHGGKSLLLNNELKKGPALFVFLPFDPLADHQPLVEQISRLALEYNRCNKSHRGQAEAEAAPGGRPSSVGPSLALAESSVSITTSPCCNTVVLPLQWHSLSRTHNVCELCVNRTAGIRPSRLGNRPPRLPCSFLHMEAALDLFYLKERTFFHLLPGTVSLCRNFLHFYSPFGYYTACCRTVDRLGSASPPPETSVRPLGALLASYGKRWEVEPPIPMPHVEGRRGLLPGVVSSCGGSALSGLSCKTNKTLNLYLLDSNLFWMFAERLGAARAAPRKEFAAIVDVKEEMHYVSDQDRPLLRSSLETFIQNYSVLYSPLKRHLVGDARPGPSQLRRRIRDVTTRTFHEVVLENEKDVLLLYYAPWCGFCTSLNHIFIQLARILPPDHFTVARVDVSRNDLPWEFMTDLLPNVLFFPRDRQDQSVAFSPDFPLSLPNLLKFALRHASQPLSSTEEEEGPCPPEGCLRRERALLQGRLSHLEREVGRMRGQLQALHRAQVQLQGQLRDARREGRRLGQEAQILRTQHGALQGLYAQRMREAEGLAEKLQELADASEKLLAENALLKVLLASTERKGWGGSEPESGLPSEEEAGLEKEEEEEDSQADRAIASEPPSSRETQME